MLSPSYLEQVPDRLVELYAEVEAEIIASMAERISKMDFIPSAEWQYKKLTEMGYIHDEIIKKLSKITGLRKRKIERLMKEAGVKTINADSRIYKKAGLNPPTLNSSENLQKVLQAGYEQTNGLFDNLTRTTADTATRQFEGVLDRAWLEITSGAFDYNSSIRRAIKDLSAKGIQSIKYPSGHVDYLDVAVRRAVVTGVNQAGARIQLALADEMGCDLVEVTAHSGARPTHAVWQGKIYSRSGTHPKYPDFVKSTGYGTGPGLCGWNCRHNFYPYFEGTSRTYSDEELAEMNAPKYTYNGKKLTEYEATQIQRYNERQIRRWKREYKAMEAAGQPTDEAAAKLRSWLERQKNFLEQTGLKRQYERENVVGFSREEAKAATKGAERYYQNWSKSIGANDSIKTLAEYYGIKYNNSTDYELLKRYARGVEGGWISPNSDFSNYCRLYFRVQNEIVGETTSNGIIITGQSRHFMHRVLGTKEDPITKRSRSGVEIDDIKNALQNGVPRKIKEEKQKDGSIKKSQKFVTDKCDVSVNPETGMLIQCNPR